MKNAGLLWGIVAPIIFYTIVGLMLGFVGQETLLNKEIQETIGSIDTSQSVGNLSSVDGISLLDAPSFIDGLVFSVGGLPAWANTLMGIPVFILIISLIILIRGGGT